MTHYSEFYHAIDDIAEHLRADLIGPIEENEVLEIEEPLSRYALGILWAQTKNKNAVSSDVTMTEELFEDETAESEKPKNTSVFKPSSMGISFTVSPDDKLKIEFNYALYHHSDKTITDKGKEIKRHMYTREARQFQTSVVIPDTICSKIISDRSILF